MNGVDTQSIVIDQSCLRKPELIGSILDDPSVLIFPDVAFIEILKTENWAENMRYSLQALSRFKDRVLVSLPVGEMLKLESSRNILSRSDLIDLEVTEWFRDLLKGLYQDESGMVVDSIGLTRAKEIENLYENELNHTKNYEAMIRLISTLKRGALSEKYMKELRAGRIDNINEVIYEAAPYLMEEYSQLKGLSEEDKREFLLCNPVCLRFTYSRLWLCLNWIKKGGIESVKPEKITNDILDHEYVITASYFDGLLSRDANANDAYSAIKSLVQR